MSGVGPAVLLVDGDQHALEIASYALTREGFTVGAAADGQTALERLRKRSWDLVLLDIVIPGTNGYELCRQIRAVSSTPVIMISDRREEEQVARGFVVGADDYVVKPLSFPLLGMRMRAVLNRALAAGRESASSKPIRPVTSR